jgi:hypothetical protein
MQGGNNKKYFHLIANAKHRRKKIFQLEQDEGTIIGQENIKNYIIELYKNLFGPPSNSHFLFYNQRTMIFHNYLKNKTISL